MELIICIAIFAFVLLIFAGFYNLLKGRRNQESDRLRQRLRVVSPKGERSQTINIVRKSRVLSNVLWLDSLLRNIPFLQKIDRILLQSNLQYPLGVFFLSSILLAFFGYGVTSYITGNTLFSVLAAVVLSIIPFFCILMKRNFRMKKFEKQLPGALDMVARSLKAGHAFTGGLQMVAEEFDDPIGGEFAIVIEEFNFGVGIKEALIKLTERIDCPDLKFLTIAVTIQRETGGDLAEILENIASLIRERFKLHDKILTLSGEGRISAKVLIAIPFGLGIWFYLSNPGYIKILLFDPIGQKLIFIAVIMMAVGIFTMKKLISIKV